LINLTRLIAKYYVNSRGWKTKRKIVVFESDDWGSVRVASNESIANIKKKCPKVSISRFAQLDGLERTQDLELLFELLCKFKDSKGNNPVITALSLTSNPDFDKIKENNFEYFSELITETYRNYGEINLFEIWKNEGISNNLLFPQFHGKEHLHPERYISRIVDLNDFEHHAFLNNSILGGGIGDSRIKNFLAANEYHSDVDKSAIENRIKEGLKEFEQLFGFHSTSFCPSQSIYGEHIFDVLKENGILAIQAGQQFKPHNFKLKKIENYWGNTTANGLVFWRRNCTFEIYKGNHIDHISDCLREIEIAFSMGKPAVINSHRINFTSRLNTDIRDKTLVDLEILLKTIIKNWPEVEFFNSAQLANEICK
jgi:phosphoribosylanthranilate isomerase